MEVIFKGKNLQVAAAIAYVLALCCLAYEMLK